MEDFKGIDEFLLSLLEHESPISGGDDLYFIEDIHDGNFLKVLLSSKCEEICCRYVESNTINLKLVLERSLKMYVDKHCSTLKQQLDVLSVGIASLNAFIQTNWTGPAFEHSDCGSCILPWMQTLHERCENEKDVREEVTGYLVLDGESCNPNINHPELLFLAYICLHICTDMPNSLLSSRWWLMRCLFIQQQIIEELSPTLHIKLTTIMEDLAKCEKLMSEKHNLVCFHLEAAQIHLFYRHVTKSLDHCNMALKAAHMEIELTGALGKRTQFQVKDLAQLTVKVSVAENNKTINFPSVQPEFLPKDLRLQDEVRLNKIKFVNESDGLFPNLQPIEQAVVLGLFIQTQKSQPKDNLADEELLPYLTCILSLPLAWSIQMSALLQRCRLDGNHSRTVERAMMQTEELVNCFNREEPDAKTRHHYFFCSHLPPHWKIESELAKLLLSIGVVKSALDIFLRLQLWEEVILCYNMLKLRHKAAEVIQQELNKEENVKLWCLLGDATDDTTCYEKAWELSKHKSGRAQRHWAMYYFNRKQYADSIPHFQESLSINSLQVSLWFHLGYAALDQKNWFLCAMAYQRYCSLDPESFEAWNNLSKAYVKLNQKHRAWLTLQESLKWNYENWRVWDNYMVVSTDVGKFHEVIQAYNRILDLKEKHIDIEVLKILVNAVSMVDSSQDIKKKAEQLFMRLTQQVRNNTNLWQLFVKLMLSDTQNESYEPLEKSVSYLHKAFWSAIQDSHFERDIKECLNIMQITSQLIDATFQCCEKCPSPQKSLQMLASAKLCLQTLIARIKKNHSTSLSSGDAQEAELAVSLQDLETKLQDVVKELQERKGITST